MRNAILLATAFFLLLGLPAFAGSYLVFRDGATVTSEYWQPTAPVVGQNVPAGCVVKSWTQQNGDDHPDHYTLQGDGSISYTPPAAPPAPPPAPDPNGLAAALSSQISSPIIRLQLAAFMGVAQAYTSNSALVKQAWADLVLVEGTQNNASGWLDTTTQTTVESLANQYNMPLQ